MNNFADELDDDFADEDDFVTHPLLDTLFGKDKKPDYEQVIGVLQQIFQAAATASQTGTSLEDGLDEVVIEIFSYLYDEAALHGERARFDGWVAELRRVAPQLYDMDAPIYLIQLIRNALVDGRTDYLPALVQEFGELATDDLDLLILLMDMLAYYNQLPLLQNLMRQIWDVLAEWEDTDDEEIDLELDVIVIRAANYEIYNYLEHTAVPSATDPQLLAAIDLYAEADPAFLSKHLASLAGQTQATWKLSQFQGPGNAEQKISHLTDLISEFIGYLRHVEKMPYPKADLGHWGLMEYLVSRVLDQPDRPKKKGKGPVQRKATLTNPLCPEPKSFQKLIEEMIYMVAAVYQVTALLEMVPAWLRFLVSRQLLTESESAQVRQELHQRIRHWQHLWITEGIDPAIKAALAEWI